MENKFNLIGLKNDIKLMSNEQKLLRNQRKTEKLVGERIVPAGEAQIKHMLNREKLRIMYAAYGLMRGKSFSQMENKFPEENHPLNKFKKRIDAIMVQYENKEVEVEATV